MSIRRVEKIDNLVPVRNVMISVTDKRFLNVLVCGLIGNCPEVMIYSSGGTYEAILQILGEDEAKKHLQEVSEYTELPETEGGLVKTLHHKLFLGYLTETYCPAHQADLAREGAVPIDLAVINLYPFEKVVKRNGVDIEDARGNIDVGGPSALRAAAKNWHRVMTIPVADQERYYDFVRRLEKNKGCTDLAMRFTAWRDTFRVLSEYDRTIYEYLEFITCSDIEEIYEIVED